MSKFTGRIIALEKKDDDTNVEEDVVIECTDLHQDGQVELAWSDRNEQYFVRFKVQDLLAAMCKAHVKSSE